MENVKGLIFRHRILWHVLFWVVWYLFYSFTYGSNNEEYSKQFIANLYLLPVRMIGTYSLIYLILPYFLFRKKYIEFGLLILIHALLFGILIWFVFEFFFFCPGGIMYERYHPSGYMFKIFGNLILNYQIPAIAAGIVMFKRWYIEQQHSLVLEKEKLEAELKFLKTQIHPHFLFNTLNNLYALTLQKSDKAPDIVIMLSNQLDYILYSSNETEVKLESEINQLKGYIELEKIRYGERLNIQFNLEGDLDNKCIAPLILLPFLENSFKHGASRDTNSPYIKIDIQIKDLQLQFRIENSFKDELQKPDNYTEGIGLNNVKRRLELLYPQNYTLEITKENDIFSVLLNLRLTQKIIS